MADYDDDVPFLPRAEVSEDARFIAKHAGMNLKRELEGLSIKDLIFFLWKFWWAALLAGIIPAIAILVVAVFVRSTIG